MVLLVPVFTQFAGREEEVELDEKTHEMKLDGKNPFENQILAILFTAIRYACFLALYVGFGVVVYGLFTFPRPASGPARSRRCPRPSSALACSPAPSSRATAS